MIVTKVQATKYLKNVSSRFFPVKTILCFFQFIEYGVIEILEDEIEPLPTAKDFDHAHEILMM
jgi:hypothetical protein